MKRWLGRLAPHVLALGLAACGPAIDWREMRPDGAQLALAMPCRPSSQARVVPLAGKTVSMRLYVCSARETTFALSHADVADPAQVGAALQALGEAARRNIDGRVELDEAALVPGMTPHPNARRWRLAGRLPDGRSVTSSVTVFAFGTRVYQASVMATTLDEGLKSHFEQALAIRP